MKTVYIVGIVLGVVFIAVLLFILFYIFNTTPFSKGAKAIDKSVSNQYYFKGDKVVFVSGANFFSLGAREIENADPGSFEVLAYNIAKDNKRVYYNEIVIEEADPKTLELLAGEPYDKKYNYCTYSKDSERVFYLYQQIKGADAKAIKYLWGDFAKDDQAIYYRENKILDAFENALSVENDNSGDYLITNNVVYFQDQLIEGAHADDFTIVKESFAKDNNAVFFENKLVIDADPGSFQILNGDFQRDNDLLYYKTKPIFESDPNSFEFVNTLFSKDKNNLYYIGLIVKGMGPKNFGIRQAEKLADDPSMINLIYDEHYTLFAKRNELTEISRTHNLYLGELYCFGSRIIGADPKTFTVFDGCEEMYAADKNHVYYHSTMIKDADIASFQAINSKFAKDDNYVYFFERRLREVDPDTFIYQEGMYGETIDEEYDRLVYPNSSINNED